MGLPEAGLSLRDFGQTFSDAMSAALAGCSDQKWIVAVSAELDAASENPREQQSFALVLKGSLNGKLLLSIASSGMKDFQLREASDSGAESAGPAASFEPVLRQLMPLFSKGLQRFGQTSVETQDSPFGEVDPGATVTLSATCSETQRSILMTLALDATLAASLAASSGERFSYPAAPEASANLDLVLDVELNVTLRFGQRQLSLREVLDLNSGSVVELDRQVDEPVELVLDGRVVARGEAVIIDGNYGMRITQVVQKVIAS